MLLFVGDDWAESHHDVEIQDAQQRVLTTARVPEGVDGIARVHELLATYLPEDADPGQVAICIETDRGQWVAALVAAGYRVYGVNPKQASRHREGMELSGAKSDKTDAHALADMARTRHRQLREIAADSAEAQAVRVVARAHQTLIWERTRHLLRLRTALRHFFPAAVVAYRQLGLSSSDVLELLDKAPDPESASRLSLEEITDVLQQSRRHHVREKAQAIQDALRAPHLEQPAVVASAYAATVRTHVAILQTLTRQVTAMESEVTKHFRQHPDWEIYCSQPGMGVITGARVLGEFGDAPGRYATAKSRKNYAGTAPITRQSGKTKTVHARYIHNDRLVDALHMQASCAIVHDAAARAYYDELRARNIDHNPALRQLGNRLVGILHGCLKNHTSYDRATAWAQRYPRTA